MHIKIICAYKNNYAHIKNILLFFCIKNMPCYGQNSLPCECTYSTAAINPDATTVLTKIGDDFPFRGIDGINGILVTQNADTIFIDGANIGTGSLQTAYNGGNTIVTAGNLPVDISGTGDLLAISDTTPTGLFSITNAGLGDANIAFTNNSGFVINNPVQLVAPTPLDPFTNILVGEPPTAVSNLSTILSTPNIGLVVPLNIAYTYTASSLQTVSHLRLHLIGIDNINGSFSIESVVKFSPLGASPIITGTNAITSDPALSAVDIQYTFSGQQLNFVLINPNILVTARVQIFLIATVMTY
jgi:hypothetical protein